MAHAIHCPGLLRLSAQEMAAALAQGIVTRSEVEQVRALVPSLVERALTLCGRA